MRAMVANDYTGVVEPRVVHLALGRMRQFGIPRHEWDDVLQEVAIRIAVFHFDPAKANGASRSTAACGVITKYLLSAKRSEERYCRCLERVRPEETYEDLTPLRLGVRSAVARLSPREQAVALQLMRGASISHIAETLRCDRSTVRRLIAGIRRQFQAQDLQGWVRQ